MLGRGSEEYSICGILHCQGAKTARGLEEAGQEIARRLLLEREEQVLLPTSGMWPRDSTL
jgi:hypothetical protein